MNPDKLFDYLEGKLPEAERSQLEKQMADDPQLQKELAAARRIHAGMQGMSGEALASDDSASTARGRTMAIRVGTAFFILISLNVAIGLFFIARHEAANPNHLLLEKQMRDQLSKSLEQATHGALTPPPLDLNEITIAVPAGAMNGTAEEVAIAARKVGGSATKELPDAHRVGVLVDVPATRETEFRAALARLSGVNTTPNPSSEGATSSPSEKTRFLIYLQEETKG